MHHQVGSTGGGHTLHPPIPPVHQERVSSTLLHQEIHLDNFQVRPAHAPEEWQTHYPEVMHHGHTLHPPIPSVHQERVSLTLLRQEIHLDNFQVRYCTRRYTWTLLHQEMQAQSWCQAWHPSHALDNAPRRSCRRPSQGKPIYEAWWDAYTVLILTVVFKRRG